MKEQLVNRVKKDLIKQGIRNHHKRNMKSRMLSFLGILVISIASLNVPNITLGAVDEDQGIVSAVISNVYTGKDTTDDIVSNIDFTDVDKAFWGREAIMRMGALDVTKGYNVGGVKQFRPNDAMSKEEAIVFIMRAIGMEEAAKAAAEAMTPVAGENTVDLWSKGYLSMANQIGILTNAQLTDALISDQTLLDPAFNFMRTDPVTREEVAIWLIQGISSLDPNLIRPIYRQQAIYGYDDWTDITVAYLPYVEAVSVNNIMQGDGKSFKPKSNLTRAEMMQVLKNMDKILYDSMNLTKKEGYVGHIEKTSSRTSGSTTNTSTSWIRVADGSVDQLVQTSKKDSLGNDINMDAVVYKQDALLKLNDLQEGDTIEYIVDETSDQVLYVQVKNDEDSYHISGVLEPFSNLDKGEITITDDSGKKQTFQMISNLYNTDNDTVLIEDKHINMDNVPVTNRVQLSIKNQMVTGISYDGVLTTSDEFNGLVIENNTAFNYIRVSDWNGKEVIKRYNKDQVIVEKEAYYDEEDQVGYFDELFPYYGFDEDDASIDEIEVGDIVYIKLDPNNTENILMISAKTNYTVKFGEVISSLYKGDAGYLLTLKMDDGTIVTYPVVNNIAVIKGNTNVGVGDIKSGDIIRILVNQAVTAPGTIRENIKEVMIDPYGNYIEQVYKGILGRVDNNQQTLTVLNGYRLLQNGWSDFKSAITLDMSGDDIHYYLDNKQISLDYATKYLKNNSYDMYVVTEQYYGDERVKKVTFRDGRDSVLGYDNISVTNGVNQVQVQNYSNSIAIDDGTIVVKNNKLISPSNIIAPDYAQIVLNGSNQAAVVTIKPEPNNDAISVFRGRIAVINDYDDFTVQSHAVLQNNQWIYSPIERTYELDYKTVIKDGDGIIGLDEFIGYTDITKVDKVYNIVADGTNATYISDAPYATESVKGEIFQINADSGEVSLKNTLVYNKDKKEWNELSKTDSYSLMTHINASIVIKNNKVIDLDELVVGDELKVMTTVDLAEQLKLEDSRTFIGYIIFVE